jgi:hypothetical protein
MEHPVAGVARQPEHSEEKLMTQAIDNQEWWGPRNPRTRDLTGPRVFKVIVAIRCERCKVGRSLPITECGWKDCPHLYGVVVWRLRHISKRTAAQRNKQWAQMLLKGEIPS